MPCLVAHLLSSSPKLKVKMDRQLLIAIVVAQVARTARGGTSESEC